MRVFASCHQTKYSRILSASTLPALSFSALSKEWAIRISATKTWKSSLLKAVAFPSVLANNVSACAFHTRLNIVLATCFSIFCNNFGTDVTSPIIVLMYSEIQRLIHRPSILKKNPFRSTHTS